MRALIAAPFVDSRAADLSLAFGLDRLPALGTHRVELPGASVELRVLGASHQVVLDVDGFEWSETVACLPDRAGALPTREQSRVGDLVSRFAARCVRLAPAELAARTGVLRRHCEGHPHALVGTFPGSPLAVTAMVVDPTVDPAVDPAVPVGWWSWHAYPQTGELVTTRSVLVSQDSAPR